MSVNNEMVKRFVKDLEVGKSMRISLADVLVTDTSDYRDAFVNIYTLEDPEGEVKITRLKGKRDPFCALQAWVLEGTKLVPVRNFNPHPRSKGSVHYSDKDRELFYRISSVGTVKNEKALG